MMCVRHVIIYDIAVTISISEYINFRLLFRGQDEFQAILNQHTEQEAHTKQSKKFFLPKALQTIFTSIFYYLTRTQKIPPENHIIAERNDVKDMRNTSGIQIRNFSHTIRFDQRMHHIHAYVRIYGEGMLYNIICLYG